MLVNYGPASQISSSEFLLRVSQLEKSDYDQTLKLAQIEGTVDGITSTVSEEFIENVNNTTKKVSNIEQTVDSIKTAVTNEENGTIIRSSTLLHTVDGFEARVVALEKGGTGTIAENVLRFDAKTGLVVDGNGGTVTIGSGNLNLTGAIIFSDITDGTSSVNNLINNNPKVTDAGDALDMAQALDRTVNGTAENNGRDGLVYKTQNARDIMADWISGGGSTYINGSSIKTGTLYSKQIHMGGDLTVYTTETGMTEGGKLGYASSTLSTGDPGMHMVSPKGTGEVHVTDKGAYMRCKYNNLVNEIGAAQSVISIAVQGANYYFRSTGLQLQDGTISTSDRNYKNSIEDLPEKYIDLFDNLAVKRYKLNAGTSDRYHVGFLSQEVEEAMNAAGIDSQEFAGFVIGEDEEGNDKYMLRYDEFIGILTAKIKQLESRIEQLEAN